VSRSLRIIAGRFKGKKLVAGEDIRPTSDRAREALFDILGPSVSGCRFLDLFAGSGAVGFEALSRGAEGVTLIERRPRILEENRRRLGEEGLGAVVIAADAAVELRRPGGPVFDIVFADPPYQSDLSFLEAPELMSRVRPGGRLIVQADRETAMAPPFGFWFERVAGYGRNVFHFFRRKA
jgi:16S rRNA (guanine966-N2)-methyltransferase